MPYVGIPAYFHVSSSSSAFFMLYMEFYTANLYVYFLITLMCGIGNSMVYSLVSLIRFVSSSAHIQIPRPVGLSYIII